MTETEQTVHVAPEKTSHAFRVHSSISGPDFLLIWPWILKLYQHQPVELVDTTRKCIHQYWLTLEQRNIQFRSSAPSQQLALHLHPLRGGNGVHHLLEPDHSMGQVDAFGDDGRMIPSSLQACSMHTRNFTIFHWYCLCGWQPNGLLSEKPLIMKLSSWDLAEDLLHLDSFFHELTW